MISINFKKLFIACVILCAFLCITAVSATDINETTIESTHDTGENLEISEDNNVLDAGNAAVISTKAKTSPSGVYVKDSKFDIQILDGKGNAISNKSVQIDFKSKVTNLTTDSNGHVYFKLYAKGTYTLSYVFKQDGYKSLSGSKVVTVVSDTASKLKGSNYVAYVSIKNPYTVTLTTGGIKMPNKKVIFTVKGKKYTKTTNSKGQATLNINLAKGTYTIKYDFKGVTNAKSCSGKSKITVKKGSPTRLTWQNEVVFKHKTSTPFILKYRDANGNVIPYKTIVLKINGKTYSKKTDKNGLVTFYIKQKTGVYKCTVSSYNTAYLKKTVNKYTIIVKSNSNKNNGFWLFGSDMKKVNLTKMARYGTKNIFLNYYAFELYGKSDVASFASEAKSLGINVHIWMQAFNDGKWISPVNSDGSYKYSLFNSIISKAKSYAAVDGVAGIHFDYLRFPGTAYKHTNGVNAINYFTKTACNALHKQNPNLIVSAAVMPEPSSMKYYYGQDIPTLSKYLDVIVPMVYKGNYGQGTSWIKSVTSSFVSQSNGAQVWTGLQGYYSDSNVKKLPVSVLTKDAHYAGLGGATGIIIFRYSLFNFFNFDDLWD